MSETKQHYDGKPSYSALRSITALSGHFCKTVVTELEKTFFDNDKTFIGIWNYPNNRPNIQTYALRTFTFSLQTLSLIHI